MPRSHPPTLITLADRALAEDCGVRGGQGVLVAVSGGGDSIALLHVLARLSRRRGFSVVAHGVDHGLRHEAAAEIDLAGALAASLGVPFTRSSLRLARGGNLQARARDARREALERARDAAGADWVATAHHADDRAETVLLRILHGARPEALAVLGPRDGRWIRPFHRARKRDILAHLDRHELCHAEDPSNRDPRFLRVRVRYELLPLLEDLSPGIVGHLTALADDLDQARDPAALPSAYSAARPALRRSHLDALRRVLRLGRPARIRMQGGRELVLTVERPPADGPRRSRRAITGDRAASQKGGAKSRKSG